MEKVPGYARPLFIRQLREMDTIGTFKMKKGDLREEAFHLEKCSDQLFVTKPGSQQYEPLDHAFYAKNCSWVGGLLALQPIKKGAF